MIYRKTGKNSKIILKFNDDTTQEEIDAIKEFFENMYKDFAKMLGISEEELDNLCKTMEYLDNLDEKECEEMVSKILNETLQNSNMDAKLAKKLKDLDEINGPTEEELKTIEQELSKPKENKVINLSDYRKR